MMNQRSNYVLPDITAAIGSTPIVELSRLVKHYKVEGKILAKLEYLNPGFSKKDRIAKQIILDAKESGELKEGQTVVELTSGNTGTGLAIVCGVYGHPFIAVMSTGNSMERARMMKALGAKVVLVDQAIKQPGKVSGEDLALVEEKTKELVKKFGAFRADQFIKKGNAKAHRDNTGPEIWKAAPEITAFCDFVGTGGSFGGCASYLKPKGVRCYVVEPLGAAVLNGKEVTQPNHRIQGGGYMMKDLSSIDDQSIDVIDGFIEVTDDEAIQGARDLALKEGIFGGFSAGANVAAAVKLLKDQHVGKDETIVILVCDSGLKYLSTDLWE